MNDGTGFDVTGPPSPCLPDLLAYLYRLMTAKDTTAKDTGSTVFDSFVMTTYKIKSIVLYRITVYTCSKLLILIHIFQSSLHKNSFEISYTFLLIFNSKSFSSKTS